MLWYIAPFLFICCQADVDKGKERDAWSGNIEDLNVPGDFNFATLKKVEASLQVYDLQDQPMGGVRISFYTKKPAQGGKRLSSVVTNPAGMADALVGVPAHLQEVYVHCHLSGMVNWKKVPLQPNISVKFGGKPQAGNAASGNTDMGIMHIRHNFYYRGSFEPGNTNGQPYYLLPQRNNISSSFLHKLNTSLPQKGNLPESRASYFAQGNNREIVVKQPTQIEFTYLSAESGTQHALSYYVYNTNDPPQNPSQIDSVFILLPNSGMLSDAGGMQPGDKIDLGTFEGGKTIAWVLLKNAWYGNGIDINAPRLYSNPEFNSQGAQQSVQLFDANNENHIFGFEDHTGNNSSELQDYNDLLFYVSAGPAGPLETGNIPLLEQPKDYDGDGVYDVSDDYPKDAAQAIHNIYWGTLAFEDLWPYQGDYDFNDLVLSYRIDHFLNSGNKLVNLDANWTVEAVGATFMNGFGFQFAELPDGKISSVEGQSLSEGIINTNGNGTESGQSKATIIVFDNVFNRIQAKNNSYINTLPQNPKVSPSTQEMSIQFQEPQNMDQIGLPPYNPFIFVDGQRGREIHLPGMEPTALADAGLFGTQSDYSDPAFNRYYKTQNNLPWVIHLSEGFDYPVEYEPINEVYHYFSQWAVSGGQQYPLWFSDAPGYRDKSKIY